MCNGENGHASTEELSEDPIATSACSEQNTKKKRKSSAEKFLEDNSEYYGFQVLPSKLRSSSVESSSFPNPFLDYLHRSNATDSEVQQVRKEAVDKKYVFLHFYCPS